MKKINFIPFFPKDIRNYLLLYLFSQKNYLKYRKVCKEWNEKIKKQHSDLFQKKLTFREYGCKIYRTEFTKTYYFDYEFRFFLQNISSLSVDFLLRNKCFLDILRYISFCKTSEVSFDYNGYVFEVKENKNLYKYLYTNDTFFEILTVKISFLLQKIRNINKNKNSFQIIFYFLISKYSQEKLNYIVLKIGNKNFAFTFEDTNKNQNSVLNCFPEGGSQVKNTIHSIKGYNKIFLKYIELDSEKIKSFLEILDTNKTIQICVTQDNFVTFKYNIMNDLDCYFRLPTLSNLIHYRSSDLHCYNLC